MEWCEGTAFRITAHRTATIHSRSSRSFAGISDGRPATVWWPVSGVPGYCAPL